MEKIDVRTVLLSPSIIELSAEIDKMFIEKVNNYIKEEQLIEQKLLKDNLEFLHVLRSHERMLEL